LREDWKMSDMDKEIARLDRLAQRKARERKKLQERKTRSQQKVSDMKMRSINKKISKSQRDRLKKEGYTLSKDGYTHKSRPPIYFR
tara:strand:+ start:197 stop:454 length:258 start_codon:yes stop_codon:yes gene_type:complete